MDDTTMSKKFDTTARYVFSIVLSVLGYLILHHFVQFENSLQTLSNELVTVRMKLVEIENKMLDENRVREIVKLEMKGI